MHQRSHQDKLYGNCRGKAEVREPLATATALCSVPNQKSLALCVLKVSSRSRMTIKSGSLGECMPQLPRL